MKPVTDYIEQATERIAKRKERELYCAWRAGYDYLYEIQRLADGFKTEREYIPSDEPHREFNDRRRTIVRYDLSRISHTDIRGLDSSHIPTGR